MKIEHHANGAATVIDKLSHEGFFIVKLYRPNGGLEERTFCHSYIEAMACLQHYNRLAKIY